MWILTAIFQAIGQAFTWVFPVSESGHSVIFHNFSGRFTNACSQLTGVIHIGIAIGLFIAFYKLFSLNIDIVVVRASFLLLSLFLTSLFFKTFSTIFSQAHHNT